MPFVKRKAFGQHLLKHPASIQAIVDETFDALKDTNCRKLLEIGPGKGAITRDLISRNDNHFDSLTLIEKDNAFAENLKTELDLNHVSIINDDALEVDLLKLFGSEAIVIVSNLPYSVSVAILNRLIDSGINIRAMVLMFQKEVAERLLAKPGEKKRGSLSVSIQNEWEVRKVLLVKPRAFSPPPKVDSLVVRLTKSATPQLAFNEGAHQLWSFLLKSSFKQPRRMLRSNFRGLQIPSSQETMSRALDQSGVNPELRAAALNWKDWEKLMDAMRDLR